MASAADLITGKDIKDGTVKKADLVPKVRSKLGVPGPRGAQGPQGVQGLPGVAGTNGTNGTNGTDAPADGPSLVMGRIADPGGDFQCLIGPAIGLSENAGGNNLEVAAVEMPMLRTSVTELHRDPHGHLAAGRVPGVPDQLRGDALHHRRGDDQLQRFALAGRGR